VIGEILRDREVVSCGGSKFYTYDKPNSTYG